MCSNWTILHIRRDKNLSVRQFIQSGNYFNVTASRRALISTTSPGNKGVRWQPSLVSADSVTPQSITRHWELLSGTGPEVVVPFSTPSSYIPLIKPTDSTVLLSQNYSSKNSKTKQHYSLLIVLPEWSGPPLKGTSPSEERGTQRRDMGKKMQWKTSQTSEFASDLSVQQKMLTFSVCS